MTAHIRRKRAVLFLNCSFSIYIVKRSSRFRISRIMLSAMTRCVFLSRNMVSPLWSATCTTVSTSKAMARNNSSLACCNATACICGTMAAIFWSAISAAIIRISARCSSALPPCPSYVSSAIYKIFSLGRS